MTSTSEHEAARREETIVDAEKWVERHGDALFRHAMLRVRDPQVAEDLLQETFLAALKAQSGFRGESQERTWLIGILRHKILDHLRRSGRTVSLESAEMEEEGGRVESGIFNKSGVWRESPRRWKGRVEELTDSEEFRQVLDTCLSALPHDAYEACMLQEVQRLDRESICRTLAVSRTALSSRLYRARMLLRECLERKWFAPGR